MNKIELVNSCEKKKIHMQLCNLLYSSKHSGISGDLNQKDIRVILIMENQGDLNYKMITVKHSFTQIHNYSLYSNYW